MAGRIRTIKPELLADSRVGRLSDAAFRMFVGAITLADDYGNLTADSDQLGGAVWWSRNDHQKIADKALSELHAVGLVRLYEVRGQRYAHLTGWDKHQKIDRRGGPKYPFVDGPDSVEIFYASLKNVTSQGSTDVEPSMKCVEPSRALDTMHRALDADLDLDLDHGPGNGSGGELEGNQKPTPPETPPSASDRFSIKPVQNKLKKSASFADPAMTALAQAVIDAWNAEVIDTRLPASPAFGDLPTRDRNLVARFRGHPERDVEWWRALFVSIAADPSQNGMGAKWRTQLHWLVANEDNLLTKAAVADANRRLVRAKQPFIDPALIPIERRPLPKDW